MRENKTKYGVLAMMMMVGMIAAVSALDGVSASGIIGVAAVFLVCGAVLLFCLMKLEVMDFQEGSFWYAVNLQVNAPKQRSTAQRAYTQHNTAARTGMMAKTV
mgnify:CR=1 FL=1